MSASELADALSASRSKAIAALGRAYRYSESEPDDARFIEVMGWMGLEDEVAVKWLLATWKVLRDEKAEPPGEQAPAKPKEDEATKPQLDLLDKLLREKNLPARDGSYPFTKQEAHEAIDAVKAGTYDPKRYEIPF